MIERTAPVVDDHGGSPFAEHNMSCSVCWVESAVLNLNEGLFEPCWICQSKGWRLNKKRVKRLRRKSR